MLTHSIQHPLLPELKLTVKLLVSGFAGTILVIDGVQHVLAVAEVNDEVAQYALEVVPVDVGHVWYAL